MQLVDFYDRMTAYKRLVKKIQQKEIYNNSPFSHDQRFKTSGHEKMVLL
jgi:hypothetical protein